MIKKLIYAAFAATLILTIGSAGFFVPKLISDMQDKNEEGQSEKLELEEIVLNYGTEPSLVEKLRLYRDSVPIYHFEPAESVLTHAEAEQKVISYLTSVLKITGEAELFCSSEPLGMLFENGETLLTWYVHLYYGYGFVGEFIIDDKSGMILGFHIDDFSEDYSGKDLLEGPSEKETLDDAVLAEKLIESYGILNCEYKNGYIHIPISEEEVLKLRLSKKDMRIEFNNELP